MAAAVTIDVSGSRSRPHVVDGVLLPSPATLSDCRTPELTRSIAGSLPSRSVIPSTAVLPSRLSAASHSTFVGGHQVAKSVGEYPTVTASVQNTPRPLVWWCFVLRCET
ncbi:hypothetical protein ACCO45_008485 [Purpureocillium lilacinum]|uniref:Uncharacterized protein n=1 Tax=Purpureocillium lilacinum TaxID=33203 RepID=A0ACC4DNF7_PURLI